MKKDIGNWRQSGQAALIVLLVVAVTLGFGLSIISQSTTDIKISQHEQEASRAFSAAEIGIETALQNISSVTLGESQNLSVDDVDINYTVTDKNTLDGVFNENETAQIILGGTNNTLTVEWVDSTSDIENPGNCSGVTAESNQTAASLLITVIDNADQMVRYGVNACSLNGSNGMEDVSDAGGGNFLRTYDISVTANDVLARIRPIYNQTSLRAFGATELPIQTYVINSQAQAETQESKAVEVTRNEPATPSIFDYVLFSGSSITK